MKSISIIIATLNSGPILEKCLQSIRQQDYDQEKIEIIVADGGSIDGTVEMVKKYKGKVVPENTGSPEAAKSIALKHAQNEIILAMNDDTILPNQNWIRYMVSFFDKEPGVTGCYTWRYTYKKNDQILSRYFALLGGNDPVALFLNKADRQSYLSSKWNLKGKAQDKGEYFLVEFDAKNLPTVGCNGFLIKRELLNKAKIDPKFFFHIDVNLDLVNQGFNKYVVVKNDVWHSAGENVCHFLKKRLKYMETLYIRDFSKRRYFIYSHKDKKANIRIIAFSLYAVTLILPTLTAIRGFLRVPDIAWFLHPIICFSIFWIYAWTVIKWRIKLFLKRLSKVSS